MRHKDGSTGARVTTLPAVKLENLIASSPRDVISTMLSDVDYLKSGCGIAVGTECQTFDHYHSSILLNMSRLVLSTSWNAFMIPCSFTNQVLTQLVGLGNRQNTKT